MGIIFDLDQTLVDSSSALSLRDSRKWKEVYPLIPGFTLYDGLNKVFEFLNDSKIPVVLVTSSPSIYCTKVANYFKIPYSKIIGFHDTTRRKPHPDPILKAIDTLGLPPDKIISFGDDPRDIIASKAANVHAIGCLWGSSDKDAMMTAKADAYISIPLEIIEIVKSV